MRMPADKPYVWIPVWTCTPLTVLSIFAEDEKIFEFEIGQEGEGEPDFYAALPVRSWSGKTLSFEGIFGSGFFNKICSMDDLPDSKEKQPAVHFTAASGWINDPNGLFYRNGEWHLYFQHNPFHVDWGNMSWGHAVSTDLLHWVQKEDVMFPDEDGSIFSGSAVLEGVERMNFPDGAVVFPYTASGGYSAWSRGKSFVQKAAFSLDGGMTLHKMKQVLLPHLADENRDPKVYPQTDGDGWYMVLYLEKNEYGIFSSKDFRQWEMTQKLIFPDAWECPDLFQVPVEGGGKKWMFWTPDGYYFLGEFDGKMFRTDYVRHEAYHSMLPYAAQRFVGTERVLTMAWFRTEGKGKTYTGMMGIPRELSLVGAGDSMMLCQKLPREWEEKKTCMGESACDNGKTDGPVKAEISCQWMSGEGAREAVIEWMPVKTDFVLNLCGAVITLKEDILTVCPVAGRAKGVAMAAKKNDKEADQLAEEGVRCIRLPRDIRKMSFLLDAEILELTGNDGTWISAYEMDQNKTEQTDSISLKGIGVTRAACYHS